MIEAMKDRTQILFSISFSNKTIRLKTKHIPVNESLEQWIVEAKNGHLIFQSNRPIIRKHSKTKKFDLKLLLPINPPNMSLIEAIRDALYEAIKREERRPATKYVNPKDYKGTDGESVDF